MNQEDVAAAIQSIGGEATIKEICEALGLEWTASNSASVRRKLGQLQRYQIVVRIEGASGQVRFTVECS